MYLAQISDAVAPHVRRARYALMRDLGIRGIGVVVANDIYPDRFVQVLRDKRIHPLGKRRREEHLLNILLRQRQHERVDILLETHRQHLVRLVQDQYLARGKIDGLAPDVVEQAPRRADQQVDAGPQVVALRPERRAAVEAPRHEAGGGAHRLEVGEDLAGQLARRRHGERQGRPLRALPGHEAQGSQPLHARQHKGERLAAAGLGAPDHVLPSEGGGERLTLDLEERGDASVLQHLPRGLRDVLLVGHLHGAGGICLYLPLLALRRRVHRVGRLHVGPRLLPGRLRLGLLLLGVGRGCLGCPLRLQAGPLLGRALASRHRRYHQEPLRARARANTRRPPSQRP
mmetsp:Transcript_37075/g.99522  ORF Transcript_37075/g.99522 Transcript_37075/m.99522 type:complete len:344 (-) Transcript_37075:2-1033(-)